jgi:hypothetical protein
VDPILRDYLCLRASFGRRQCHSNY